MRVLLLLAAAAGAAAQTRITEGDLKLIDTPAGAAREGPSWDPAGFLYFVGNNRLSRLDTQGKVEAFLDPSPGANGSLVDPQDALSSASRWPAASSASSATGPSPCSPAGFQGKRFNSPNDLAIDSKGRVYFTDPRYGRRDNLEIVDAQGKTVEGVYRIDAPGQVTRILEHEVDRPNGILVAPGDAHLFVADNNNDAGGVRKLWRFDLKKDGTVDPATRKLIFDWHTARGPDGFKMDREGRLYVAAGLNRPSRSETTDEFKGGVFVISPAGKLLEFVAVPKDEATNCAFGGADLKTLYITAGGSLYSIRTRTAGQISAR